MAFIQKKKTPTKCDRCKLNKKIVKNSIQCFDPSLKTHIGNKETSEVIIIFHRNDSEKRLKRFQKYLSMNNIENYCIVFGLKCSPVEFPDNVTQNKVYKYCNTFNINDYPNAKVIMTVGSGVMAVTHNSDIQSWEEYREFIFNQTYFLTGFKDDKKLRVYPLPTMESLYNMTSFEYHFFKIQASRVNKHLTNFKPEYSEKYNIVNVDNVGEFISKHMDYDGYMAIDTETNSLNTFSDNFKVGCVTISFDGITGYFLNFDKCNLRKFNKFLSNKKLITANGKYDKKALYNVGISKFNIYEDITILYHLLNTDRMKNGLKSMSWILGFGGYDDKLDEFKSNNKIKNYLDIPHDVMLDYSVLDAILTFRLWNYAMDNLVPKQPKVYEMYKKEVIPNIDVFFDMEVEGVRVDIDYMNQYNSELLEKELSLSNDICNDLGVEPLTFNIGSDEQLGLRLEKLGLPCYGRVEKGSFKTGVEVLKKWKYDGYEIASKILEFRGVKKRRTSFVGEMEENEVTNEKSFSFNKKSTTKSSNKKKKEEGLVKFIDSKGILRYNFGVARTSAWRQSCSGCNIQQINKSLEIRKMLVWDDDYIWGEFDISGFHMRLMAIMSGDKELTKLFKSDNPDAHSLTAKNVFCRDMSFEDFMKVKHTPPYKDYRQSSKSVNFSYIYNGHYSLLNDTINQDWSDEAKQSYVKDNNLEIMIGFSGEEDIVSTITKDIKAKFMQAYQGIEPYIESQIMFAEENGYLESELGGRRHLPAMKFKYIDDDIKSKQVKHLHNICANTSILNFEAIYMQRCMRKIRDELISRKMKSKSVLMVHDSVALKIHKDEVLEIYDICMNILQDFDSYPIPITADCSLGLYWGFGKEVDRDTIEYGIKNNNLVDFLKDYEWKNIKDEPRITNK
jgi:DNA polymerase-1